MSVMHMPVEVLDGEELGLARLPLTATDPPTLLVLTQHVLIVGRPSSDPQDIRLVVIVGVLVQYFGRGAILVVVQRLALSAPAISSLHGVCDPWR